MKLRIMWILFGVIAALAVSVIVFINQPKFGKTPAGDRLERVKNSPNYRDGSFKNIHETQQITSGKGFFGAMLDFLVKKKERLRPEADLPIITTDLWALDRQEELLIWFGHSSYLIQTGGIRILVDPVFSKAASPVSFFNKSFKGTDVYKPEDMPEVDYLFISHDHWDHLDYETVMNLKNRTGKVVCALGVGQHFERWGFNKDRIVELDWDEDKRFDDGVTIYCLPARHFSGRGLPPNQSLWASYLVEIPSRKIYIGGDSGYDTHYAEIGQRFEGIDLAILENGQYDKNWRYIHLLPERLIQAFKDLNAKRLFTVHHSKYALGNHPWDEPLKNVASFAEADSIPLILPMMGEPVKLDNSNTYINKWWEGIN